MDNKCCEFPVTAEVVMAIIYGGFILLYLHFKFIDPYRKRNGIVVEYFGGREPEDGISVSYFDKGRELHFYGNRQGMAINIPNPHLWLEVMPLDFRHDRDRIMGTIKKRVTKYQWVESDTIENCSVVYVDKRHATTPKVINIGR